MDEEKLVEIVEELKADIYHKHEVRSERELGILLQVEQQRAKENMSKGGNGERVGNISNPSEDEPTAARDKAAGEDPSRETFHDTEKGRAKNKAAEKVNAEVSGRTLEKGKKVKDIAEGRSKPELNEDWYR